MSFLLPIIGRVGAFLAGSPIIKNALIGGAVGAISGGVQRFVGGSASHDKDVVRVAADAAQKGINQAHNVGVYGVAAAYQDLNNRPISAFHESRDNYQDYTNITDHRNGIELQDRGNRPVVVFDKDKAVESFIRYRDANDQNPLEDDAGLRNAYNQLKEEFANDPARLRQLNRSVRGVNLN